MSYHKLVVVKTFDGFFHVEFDETFHILQYKKSLIFLKLSPTLLLTVVLTYALFRSPTRTGDEAIATTGDRTQKKPKSVQNNQKNLNINNFRFWYHVTPKMTPPLGTTQIT